ncbi:MAG TPA: hypothetical protein VLT36_16810, partial [Candidatus Dormibacteraeota bacterium]|nr:hypothetical protein [Candidatus Dormibacteraeota bacterium]
KLKDFDRNWPTPLREQFKTVPAEWLQKDQNGRSLPSWYGGDYEPACMNNPDWRAYEKFMIRQQLESGCDGIFFDNPTVHPQGCYCDPCMAKFGSFLRGESSLAAQTVPELRQIASQRHEDFLRFRCTIARDFLQDMRNYARTITPDALITANNSLNSADVLYSQCRSYAYNIYEMSKTEDFVVVEDMSSQPRTLANGTIIEYGPTYRQLTAISHRKPVVAVTLAEADYHTAPNLVRLAMAEATANRASYMCWPTWPEPERERMVSQIRPEADFLRENAGLFQEGNAREDVLVFLPFRKWLKTDRCGASQLAATLSSANVQYGVFCEDVFGEWSKNSTGATFDNRLNKAKVLLAESAADFLPNEKFVIDRFVQRGGNLVTAALPNWMARITPAVEGSLRIEGPPSIRVRIYDQPKRTLVHLLNLNVQRVSSFEDRVTAAQDIDLTIKTLLPKVRTVRALSADSGATTGRVEFRRAERDCIQTKIGSVQISTLLIIE